MSARGRGVSERDERLRHQKEQIDEIVAGLQDTVRREKKRQKKSAVLESVSDGLYDELDKLSKKAPAEPVTALALSEINQVISDVKEVAVDDPYIQRLNIFVPAGDNPEHRDAVVVMRLLRQGLERLRSRLGAREERIAELVKSARTIQAALTLRLNGVTSVDKDALHQHVMDIAREWLDGLGHFNFPLLANIELKDQFSLE